MPETMDPRGSWMREFPGRIVVCDGNGTILAMNDRAEQDFANSGGRGLIGSNVLDCHPQPARSQLERQLETGQVNAYTVEKKGVRRLIYQAPWYIGGQYSGLVELSLEIPHRLPHFDRDSS